jgi:bacterial/archaeal transporter family-2 protein
VSGGTTLAVALCVAAGIAGPVQVAVMGELGGRIGEVEAIAFSIVVSALLALTALLVVRQSFDGIAAGARAPAWLWLGGVMSLLIVLAITVAGPRIGTTPTVAIVIAGNLTMAAVVDRFGLFGVDQVPIGWERIAGIVLLAAGAALTLR